MSPRVLVAGIGNIFLSDDGFGPEVVRRLAADRSEPPESVRIEDFGIRGVHLAYELLEDYDAVVLVDAQPAGDAAGTVRVVAPDRDLAAPDDANQPRPGGAGASAVGLDAHAMDPVAVLRSARAMGGHVRHLVLIGCEPAQLGEGIGLSAPVRDAIGPAVAAVRETVAALLRVNGESAGVPTNGEGRGPGPMAAASSAAGDGAAVVAAVLGGNEGAAGVAAEGEEVGA